MDKCWLTKHGIEWFNRKSTAQVNDYGYGAVWMDGALDHCWVVSQRYF